MALKGFSRFVDGYRLLNGTKFNNLFGGGSNPPTGIPTEQIAGLAIQKWLAKSCTPAATAVGTNRATALPVTTQITDVTSAAAGTGVVLPLGTTIAGPAAKTEIFNAGANAIKVYASGSDTIDGTAGVTGVTLSAGNRCAYFPISVTSGVTTWISAQLGAVSS